MKSEVIWWRSITATASAASASAAIVFGPSPRRSGRRKRVIKSRAVSARTSAASSRPRRRSPSVTTPIKSPAASTTPVTPRRFDGHERHGVAPVHELLDPPEPPAERARGMEEGKVLGREAALLEEGHGERVAHGHGRGRARGGREAERTGLLGHAHVEDHVGVAGERRVGRTAERDQRNAKAAGDREQAQHLLALAGVGDRDQHVAALEAAQVAVAALARVQEEGRGARRGQGRGDLAAHDPRLADAREHDLAAAGEQHVDRAREARVEPLAQGREPARFDLEHAPRPGEPLRAHAPPRARTARSTATSSASSVGSASSGTLVGPSEGARSGSSCTSRKTASTPTATAARASGATNARSPPEAVPSPPGRCTLWVASNTTGQPVAASTGSARMSATRFW